MKNVIDFLILSPLWLLIRADDVSNAKNVAESFLLNRSSLTIGPKDCTQCGHFIPYSGSPVSNAAKENEISKNRKEIAPSSGGRLLQENQIAQDRFNPSTFAHLKHLKEHVKEHIKGHLHKPIIGETTFVDGPSIPGNFLTSNQFLVADDTVGAETSDSQFINGGTSNNQFISDANLDNQYYNYNNFISDGASNNQFIDGENSNQFINAEISNNGEEQNYKQMTYDQSHDFLQQPSQLMPENVSTGRIPLDQNYEPFEPPPRPGSSYLPPPTPKPSLSYQSPEQSFPPYLPPPKSYVPPPLPSSENSSLFPQVEDSPYLYPEAPRPYLPPSTIKPFVLPASGGYSYPAPKPKRPEIATYLPPKQEGYHYNPPPGPNYSYLPPPPPRPPLPPPLPPPPPPPPPPPMPPPAQMDDEEEDNREAQYYYYGIGRHLWYVPLYFSVYFIIYVGYLILRSIARHKVQFPAMLHDAAASGRFDPDDFLLQILKTWAIEKYSLRPNKKIVS